MGRCSTCNGPTCGNCLECHNPDCKDSWKEATDPRGQCHYKGKPIPIRKSAFDKAWGVVKADGSPKNRINWDVHDSQEMADRYHEYSYGPDDPPLHGGLLSQIDAPEHPDGFVIPCTFCDEIGGTPEYCEGVKWQLDEGLEGFYTSCDRELQREIDDRADDLHDMDMIEWIQRVEPADWPRVERWHNVTRTASKDNLLFDPDAPPNQNTLFHSDDESKITEYERAFALGDQETMNRLNYED